MSDRSPAGLNEWFGEVNLRNDLDASATSFLTELATMLDSLRPARMDTSRSSVRQRDTGAGVEIEIMHQVDPDSTVSVILGDGDGIISWLSAHEHIFPADAPTDRPWTTVTVDAIAEILGGEYPSRTTTAASASSRLESSTSLTPQASGSWRRSGHRWP